MYKISQNYWRLKTYLARAGTEKKNPILRSTSQPMVLTRNFPKRGLWLHRRGHTKLNHENRGIQNVIVIVKIWRWRHSQSQSQPSNTYG